MPAVNVPPLARLSGKGAAKSSSVEDMPPPAMIEATLTVGECRSVGECLQAKGSVTGIVHSHRLEQLSYTHLFEMSPGRHFQPPGPLR